MPAVIKHVKPDHVAILKQYLNVDGAVLIFGSKEQEEATALGYGHDTVAENYISGDEPDAFVELAKDSDHHLFEFMRENPIEK
jgi:hypothetical protein